MASIYQRQNRVEELDRLWKEPPEALHKVFENHKTDILILLTDMARERKDWFLLASTCVKVINLGLSATGNIEHISSVAWSVWSGFVKAIHELHPKEE